MMNRLYQRTSYKGISYQHKSRLHGGHTRDTRRRLMECRDSLRDFEKKRLRMRVRHHIEQFLAALFVVWAGPALQLAIPALGAILVGIALAGLQHYAVGVTLAGLGAIGLSVCYHLRPTFLIGSFSVLVAWSLVGWSLIVEASAYGLSMPLIVSIALSATMWLTVANGTMRWGIRYGGEA